MNPANGQHIIQNIRETLKEYRPELLAAIDKEAIILLTGRQFEMRSSDGFRAVCSDYRNQYEVSWKTAYHIIESEHVDVYGSRKFASYKSFMNTKKVPSYFDNF